MERTNKEWAEYWLGTGIPREFCRGENNKATNIKDLKALINQLPDELPVNQGFAMCETAGVRVAVMNISGPEPFVCFEECEDEFEEEED